MRKVKFSGGGGKSRKSLTSNFKIFNYTLYLRPFFLGRKLFKLFLLVRSTSTILYTLLSNRCSLGTSWLLVLPYYLIRKFERGSKIPETTPKNQFFHHFPPKIAQISRFSCCFCDFFAWGFQKHAFEPHSSRSRKRYTTPFYQKKLQPCPL